MTTVERFAKAQKVAEIITAAGGAEQFGGVSSRVAAAAWQKGDLVRVYVSDGRGYTGRQYGFLSIDTDGDVTGANGLTGVQGAKAIAALDAAGVESFA